MIEILTHARSRGARVLVAISLLGWGCGSDPSADGETGGAAGRSGADASAGHGGSGARDGSAADTSTPATGGAAGTDGGQGMSDVAERSDAIDDASEVASEAVDGSDATIDTSVPYDSGTDAGPAPEASADVTDDSDAAVQGDAVSVLEATSDSADAPADTSMPADVAADQLAEACTPAGAEDCFNGIDDDCNGDVDCADTACAPVAECVQDAPGFALGTEVASDAACPTRYNASSTSLGPSPAASTKCNGCSCTPTLQCSTTIFNFGGNTCPGGATVDSWDISGTTDVAVNSCTTGPPAHASNTMNITSGKIKVGTLIANATCPATGTPAPEQADFATKATFCQTAKVGGGCPPGNACVPRTTTKHCALKASGAVCPGNYAPELGGTWYTAIDDQRSCGNTCTCEKTGGGDCGVSRARLSINNTTCTDPATELNAGSSYCFLNTTGFMSAEVVLKSETLPTCKVSNVASGPVAPKGVQTLCCL